LAGNKNPFWGLELGAANWNWNWELGSGSWELGTGSRLALCIGYWVLGLHLCAGVCVPILLAPLRFCMFSAFCFFVILHFDLEFFWPAKVSNFAADKTE